MILALYLWKICPALFIYQREICSEFFSVFSPSMMMVLA